MGGGKTEKNVSLAENKKNAETLKVGAKRIVTSKRGETGTVPSGGEEERRRLTKVGFLAGRMSRLKNRGG